MKRLVAILLLITVIAAPASALAATPVATPTAYAHPEWLADATWLGQQLDDDQLVVIALTPPADFAQAHIPGAVQVDWPDLALSESAQIADWRMQIEALVTKLGIERTDTVVIYDGGTLYAPRLWWILYQLGHQDIRILNGGLPAWNAAELAVETGAVTAQPAAEPYVGEPNDDAIATVDEVVAVLGDPNTVLVDARKKDEFAKGHIPGAVLFPFTDVAESGQPPFWKSAEQLQSEFAALGVTPAKQVIPYCSTGVRSAALYFTLRLIGYDNVSLFSGSFAEWTADPSRPVETGDK